jgi:hypothetical protein
MDEYGSGAFDHRHAIKVNFIYEIPFLKKQKGLLGKVVGGWQLSSFYQAYSGHPIEIYNARQHFRGNALDPNGIPENIDGDYNLDGVLIDHPVFMGSSFDSAYSNNSPADGIFKDNNRIGCGFPDAKSTNIAECNASYGVDTPNRLFVNPPGYGVRFGSLGRNAFYGPWFNGLNAAIHKNFKVSENMKLQLRFEALNALNHPNFDYIDTDLGSEQFGRAQQVVGYHDHNNGSPARRIQMGARLQF